MLCFLVEMDAGNLFVFMVSGEGDAGRRDGTQRSGGAGVVSEPES